MSRQARQRRPRIGDGLLLASLAAVGACSRGPVIDLGALIGASDGANAPREDAGTNGAVHAFLDGSVPANTPELFARAKDDTDAERAPELVYPSHETMLPPNVPRLRHEWTPGVGNTLFELELRGPSSTVRICSAAPDVTPGVEAWREIAEANAGQSLQLTVRGMDAGKPDRAHRSESITVFVSALPLDGAVYYWSTGAEGIMKALISDPAPVKFHTDPGTPMSGCVGCHTLSRDGKKLAVIYEGERLEVVSVPGRTRLLGVPPAAPATAPAGEMPAPMPKPPPAEMTDPESETGGIDAAWATFSPDSTRLVVATKGKLKLIDAEDGAPLGTSDGLIALPDKAFGTHPDWSPTGEQLAVTLATKGAAKEVEAGSIAILPYDGTVFGEAQILVASSAPDDNNHFPSFSPDGRYLAYVKAKGKSRDAHDATIQLLDLVTGATFGLTRLNRRVGAMDLTTPVSNSMPVWAPWSGSGPRWLLFSSLRAYGSLRPEEKKNDQLWIAALDPEAADPGYAAFWAPFQVSTTEITAPSSSIPTNDINAAAPSCVATTWTTIVMDPLTRTTVPTPARNAEICANGVDDDCNCVVDDCSGREICDDEVDNDGDGLTDIADSACVLR